MTSGEDAGATSTTGKESVCVSDLDIRIPPESIKPTVVVNPTVIVVSAAVIMPVRAVAARVAASVVPVTLGRTKGRSRLVGSRGETGHLGR